MLAMEIRLKRSRPPQRADTRQVLKGLSEDKQISPAFLFFPIFFFRATESHKCASGCDQRKTAKRYKTNHFTDWGKCAWFHAPSIFGRFSTPSLVSCFLQLKGLQISCVYKLKKKSGKKKSTVILTYSASSADNLLSKPYIDCKLLRPLKGTRYDDRHQGWIMYSSTECPAVSQDSGRFVCKQRVI